MSKNINYQTLMELVKHKLSFLFKRNTTLNKFLSPLLCFTWSGNKIYTRAIANVRLSISIRMGSDRHFRDSFMHTSSIFLCFYPKISLKQRLKCYFTGKSKCATLQIIFYIERIFFPETIFSQPSKIFSNFGG